MRKAWVVAAVAVLGVGLAHPLGVPPREGGGEIAQLVEKARRLELLNAVSEAVRPQVAALLDRLRSLREQERQVRLAWLRAYVAQLEKGVPPEVARAEASLQVAELRAQLARERAAVREEIRRLAQENPRLARRLEGFLKRGKPGALIHKGKRERRPFAPPHERHRP